MLFLTLDYIPDDFKSFLAYEFTCASCSSRYIGKTSRHFKTRIEEHIKTDNKSHILNISTPPQHVFEWYNFVSFKIDDKANSIFG